MMGADFPKLVIHKVRLLHRGLIRGLSDLVIVDPFWMEDVQTVPVRADRGGVGRRREREDAYLMKVW